MDKRKALVSGFAGAAALNLLHESARQLVPHAPRMDVIGMRGVAKSLLAMNQEPPTGDTLYWAAIGGDLVSNGLFYSLVASAAPAAVWRRGVLLGAAAGVGAAFLPAPLGLGKQPHQRFPETHLMTIAWYLSGGLVAAAVANRLA